MKPYFSATILLLGATLSSQSALAAPVYLSCSINNGEKDIGIELTADESNSIVTVMVQGGRAPQRLNGQFSAGRVVFGDRLVVYTLDRSTLDLVRSVPGMGWTDRGSCKVEKVGRRAF